MQRTSTPASSLTVPLIVWLLIQLAALALAASGVRLSASYPAPPQSLAVHEMLIGQFVGAAVFLPVLFRGWRAWLAMIVTAGPMLLVAARLTPLPISGVLLLWVEVAAWLTALALWRAALPRRADVVAAAATLVSAGGLLFSYLTAEFRSAPDGPLLALFPLAAMLERIAAPASDPSPLLSTGALAAAAAVILTAKTVTQREARQSPEI